MTLRHYIEGVKDNQDLDPQFKSLLKHHWLEESQHTKLDTLIVEELAANAAEKEIELAFKESRERCSELIIEWKLSLALAWIEVLAQTVADKIECQNRESDRQPRKD